jgi:hypothetical protein
LADPSGYNLLMVAAKSGDQQIVEILLKLNFDVNFLLGNETPASLAWKNNQMNVLLMLLQANSLFPPELDLKKSSESIIKFCLQSKNLRIAIKRSDLPLIKRISEENPKLRYFYDEANNSAAAFALKFRKIEVYEELVKLNICIGPKENIEKVTAWITEDEKDYLRRFHRTQAKAWTETHLMVLLGRFKVPFLLKLGLVHLPTFQLPTLHFPTNICRPVL